jgi:cytoskeletal protein CcmA (bactofilin family)
MTPMCALDVSGDGSISGKLGINNTSPSCALDVTGNGKISGTLTTNNLVVNGTISGGFTFGDITTAKISNSGSITTGSLSSTGSITGDYFKVGDETTNVNSGVFIAGRTKEYYPNMYIDKIQTKRGVEVFWNTVTDARNYFRNGNSNYDGLAGDTTFVNYAGGYGQGGYSFKTTPGNGITPSSDPTVLFEMLKGKSFTIYGGLNVGGNVGGNIDISGNINLLNGNVCLSNKKVRLIRHFIAFDSTTNQQGKTIGCVANYSENLSIAYISAGKYYCTFTNINPSDAYYSVSISGTWNGQSDDNSGMIFSVDSKTTNGFYITQKGYLYYAVNSNTYTCSTEISVSY